MYRATNYNEAQEKMNIYAYTSVFEVVAKLGICLFNRVGDFDRLMVYATMIFIVQMSFTLLLLPDFIAQSLQKQKYQILFRSKWILKPIFMSFS